MTTDSTRIDFFSKQQTESIKGLLAILVLLHHVYLKTLLWESFPAIDLFLKNLGAYCVTGFFFLSGYGVLYQLKNKESYISTFQKKRVLPIVIINLTLVAIYSIQKLILKFDVTISSILLSLTYGGEVVDNGWYLLCIILFYEIFFFAAKYSPKRIEWSVLLIVLFYMLSAKIIGMKIWWYESALAFPAGIIFAKYRNRIELYIQSNYKILFILSLFSFITCFTFLLKTPGMTMFIERIRLFLLCIQGLLFWQIIMMIMMKMRAPLTFANFFSNIYLEIYVLQGFVFNLLRNPRYSVGNDLVFIILAISITIFISYLTKPVFKTIMERARSLN